MKYKAILFDLDDTLLDTANNNKDAVKDIFYMYSFDKYYGTFDDFYNAYLPNNLGLWKKYENNEITKSEMMYLRFYLPFRHIEWMNEKKALEINSVYFRCVTQKNKLIEGAIEILEELKSCYSMYILSNGFKEVQYEKIENAGLTMYFDKIILSDHIGINKPDVRLFEYALEQTGTEIGETVMIGDNFSSDITGAYRAGIDQIWFNPGKLMPKDFEPVYTVTSLSSLKKILL